MAASGSIRRARCRRSSAPPNPTAQASAVTCAGTPSGAASTSPGNVAVPIAWVKNGSRRSTIHVPSAPAITASNSTSTMPRCMYGAARSGIEGAACRPAGEALHQGARVGLDRADVGCAVRAGGAERIRPQRAAHARAGLAGDRLLDLLVHGALGEDRAHARAPDQPDEALDLPGGRLARGRARRDHGADDV